jgi:hypothetical protein
VFQGVVPKECIAQILRVTEVDSWGQVYNCCSGTFRFEQITLATHPKVQVHSNDVSLYSSAIAGFVLGKPLEFQFVKGLDFVNELQLLEPDQRLAALAVAFNLGRFAGGKPNAYKMKHRDHLVGNFALYVERTLDKVRKLPQLLPIASYAPRDWLLHVEEAIDRKAAIFSYPPFYKGGYEKMFEFLADNIAWDAPKYELFDPKGLRQIIERVRQAGVPFCILSDQVYDDLKPELEFVSGRGHPHYCYVSTGRSSFLQLIPREQAFGYKPIDLPKLKPDSPVTIVPAEAKHMTFLKNVYLKKGITHTPGMANYLVLLDGMLAGGLIYSLPRFGEKTSIYLLSDFAIARGGRLSKLITRLALNRDVLHALGKRFINRYGEVKTTAFSDHPVSMKYRGIFELAKREEKDAPGGKFMLNYVGARLDESPQEAYAWWFQKHYQAGRKN